MERKTFAVYTLLIGVVAGILGDILFFGKAFGVSFPIFTGIAIGIIIASNGLLRQPLRPRNLLLLSR